MVNEKIPSESLVNIDKVAQRVRNRFKRTGDDRYDYMDVQMTCVEELLKDVPVGTVSEKEFEYLVKKCIGLVDSELGDWYEQDRKS